MPIPFMPVNLFQRPFAETGERAVIPDIKPNPGRASLAEGFPQETQLPLTQGGVAPNRLDFNGMFNMLSAFSFWQQSGGLFNYLPALNYASPAIVVHNNMIWWCLKENGPDSPNGLKAPGAAPDYWQDLFTKVVNDFAISGGNGEDKDPATAIGGNPVGAYIYYHGTTAPDGYLHCNGSTFSATQYPRLYQVLGTAILPDLRGKFLRGLGGNAAALGVVQTDTIRNITGSVNSRVAVALGPNHTGAFTSTFLGGAFKASGHPGGGTLNFSFDASRSVPTSNEVRPVNMAALVCIRHD